MPHNHAKTVLEFIDKLEYPKIFVGPIMPNHFKVDQRIRQKGKMSPQQKALFQHANRILQHPVSISKAQAIKQASRNSYAYAIARYLEYMARQNVSVDQFTIDGRLLAENMRQYIADRLKEGKSGDFSKTIENSQHGLAFFNHCLALYKCRNIADGVEAAKKVQKLRKIPNLSCVAELAAERRVLRQKISRENFHDKNKNGYTHETYTIDNLKAMMVNMYNQTGERSKKLAYTGINAVLELLMGHHLLYRGEQKRSVELSDITYSEYDSARGKVPILGFTSNTNNFISGSDKPHVMGACRNKDAEICLVTAVAMSMWYRFDMEATCEAQKRPDFLDKRSWYPIKVLFANSANSKRNMAISYQHEVQLVKSCLQSIGVEMSKKTYLGRSVGCRRAQANQVEASQIRRAVHWRSSILEGVYLATFPLEFVFSSGGFASQEPYDCVRDMEPPESLQIQIFPWLEAEVEAVQARDTAAALQGTSHPSDVDRDTAAAKFLQMLRAFRKVIVQDLTSLMDRAPHSIFAKHPITRDPAFIAFKAKMDRVQQEMNVAGSVHERRDMANILCPSFVAKVNGVKASMNQLHLDMLKQFDMLISHQRATSQEHDRVLVEGIQSAVSAQIRDAIGSTDDVHWSADHLVMSQMIRMDKLVKHMEKQVKGMELRMETMQSQVDCMQENMVAMATEIKENKTDHQRLGEVCEASMKRLGEISFLSRIVCDRVAGPNAKYIDPLVDAAGGVDVPEAPTITATTTSTTANTTTSTATSTTTNTTNPDVGGTLKASFSPSVPPLSQAVPSLRMRPDSDTVSKLLQEWYVSSPGRPSVQKRDHLFGKTWRGASSLYKRRKALVKYIEQHLECSDAFPEITRCQLGGLLDEYRERNGLHMNALCTRVQSTRSRKEITKELGGIWANRTHFADANTSDTDEHGI